VNIPTECEKDLASLADSHYESRERLQIWMRQMNTDRIFKLRNIRCFIAFRLFFNSRFYYPVFAILFLDFGLTLEQFAVLNAVWAAAIVVLEVPSGALADIIGRKKLLVLAGWLMVVEMALLCFAPKGNIHLLFYIFIINRICSGAAEAAASGADESLAYDSLKDHQAEDFWGAVLARQMQLRSFGGVIALSVGAALYDPAFVQRLCDWIGLDIIITQDITLRIPLILTLLFALITLGTAYAMQETKTDGNTPEGPTESIGKTIVSSFRLTFKAGGWIWRTPFALVLIMAGVMFDNVSRVVITLGSQYYRLIEIPEAAFGLIGAGMAGIGMLVPSLAQRMANRRTPSFNFWLLNALTLAGLFGVSAFIPWLGLLPMVVLMVALYLLNFFLSHYLNRITESHQRATVLSFKGLSLNLAYGISGMLYAGLLAFLRPDMEKAHPQWSAGILENEIFKAAMGWFPWYFLGLLVLLLVFSWTRLRRIRDHRRAG
jgi:MFS family permease